MVDVARGPERQRLRLQAPASDALLREGRRDRGRHGGQFLRPDRPRIEQQRAIVHARDHRRIARAQPGVQPFGRAAPRSYRNHGPGQLDQRQGAAAGRCRRP